MSQSANGTVASTQLTSDQISRTSALQDGISQSVSSHVIQELNPYSPSVHRADPFNTATSAHIYPTNITAYGSSLSGATSSLSAAHYSPEERAPVTPAASTTKRKQPADSLSTITPTAPTKKRRQRAAPANTGDDEPGTAEKQEADMGPNGGPKHWTDEEKTKLFNWMLGQDEQWETFRTKMNTVFRDGSNVLFAGRKTYTALKSCYHRNLEVFKQIYAFESYLNSPAFTDETPVHGDPAVARQAVLERTLEAARAAGSLVGPLTVKVLDHWYAMGWYTLFKKRFRADASGVPVPLFGQTGAFPLPGMASPAAQAQTNIDPRLVTVSNGDEDEDAEHEQDQDQLSTTNGHPSPDPGARSNSVSYARSLLRNPESSPIRSGQLHPHDQSPSMPYAHSPGSAIPSRTSPMNYGSAYPYAAQAPLADPRPPPDWQAQTAQALTQLTAVAQSLLGVCTALADMLRSQADENRARVEMMRRGAEGGGGGASGGHGCRDTAGEGSRDKDATMMMQKVSYATEVLKNPDMNEEVRRMATDFLKRFFMQE